MTALTHKENDLHNRLIVAEFNLQQVEAELRRLHEVNADLMEALRVALVDLRIASDSGDFGLEFEPAILQGQKAISKATVSAE